jgi:hypothetical protein
MTGSFDAFDDFFNACAEVFTLLDSVIEGAIDLWPELPGDWATRYDDHLTVLDRNRAAVAALLIKHGKETPADARRIVTNLYDACLCAKQLAVERPCPLERLLRVRGALRELLLPFLQCVNLIEQGQSERLLAASWTETVGAPEGGGRPVPPQSSTPHPDGPELPATFWWQGSRYDISPIPCKLLAVLWNKDQISQDVAIEEVWGHDADVKDAALKAALNDITNCLLKARVPWTYGRKQGYIVKK